MTTKTQVNADDYAGSPFLEGCDAFYAGTGCPYPKDSDKARAWWRGWRCSDWREEYRNDCQREENRYEDD